MLTKKNLNLILQLILSQLPLLRGIPCVPPSSTFAAYITGSIGVVVLGVNTCEFACLVSLAELQKSFEIQSEHVDWHVLILKHSRPALSTAASYTTGKSRGGGGEGDDGRKGKDEAILVAKFNVRLGGGGRLKRKRWW